MTEKKENLTFVIGDKEHELLLTLDSVKHLNKLHDGGAFILIQKAISGDIDTYIDIVFAGLFHTKKAYTRKKVEEAVNQAIMDEKLDLDTINRTSYTMMADSFFYKATLNKMFQQDPGAKQQLEELMK